MSSYLQFLYRLYAPIYDRCLGRLFRDGHRKGIGCLPGDRNLRVLEIGVGTGLSLSHYPSRCEVTGIDQSPAMLAIARRKTTGNETITLIEMDAADLQFSGNHFDAVLMCYTLSVVSDPGKVMAEALRVLKPDGDLIVVNHFGSSKRMTGVLEKSVAPVARLLGFRSDLRFEDCVDWAAEIEIVEVQPANAFGYWSVAHGKKRAESFLENEK